MGAVPFIHIQAFTCIARNNASNTTTRSAHTASATATPDKAEMSVALVKSGIDKPKTTPAGEYLTSALNDFDPEQYDGLAAISDGANKLLMLVHT